MTKSTALAGALVLSNAPSTLVTAVRKVSFLATQKQKVQGNVVLSKIVPTKPGELYGEVVVTGGNPDGVRATEISTEHFISEKSETVCGFGGSYTTYRREGGNFGIATGVEAAKKKMLQADEKKESGRKCGGMKASGCYYATVGEVWKEEGNCSLYDNLSNVLTTQPQPCEKKFKGLYATGECILNYNGKDICECVHKNDLGKDAIYDLEWSKKIKVD